MGVASMTGWGRAPLQETISSVATEPPTAKKEIKIQGERQLGVPLRPEVETGNQRQNPAYDCVMCQQPHDTGLSDNIPKETQKSC